MGGGTGPVHRLGFDATDAEFGTDQLRRMYVLQQPRISGDSARFRLSITHNDALDDVGG